MTWQLVLLILGLVYAFIALLALSLWSAKNKSNHDLSVAVLEQQNRRVA